MKIIIDADACPKGVLTLSMKLGARYAVPVWTVANFHHNISSEHHIAVGGDSQEADMKIINMTQPGDVVVTQDWGLAALVIAKQAHCLSPSGREYQNSTMDFLLEEREVKAAVRRSGNRTKGPKKRTDQEDKQFEIALLRLLETSDPAL